MKKVLALAIGALTLSACGVELGFPGGTSGGSSSDGSKGDGLIMFVTDEKVAGNFGGAGNADGVCQRDYLANNPGATKQFRALVVDNSRSLSVGTWPLLANQQYIRADRTIIGKTTADRIMPGTMRNAISGSSVAVWTGMSQTYGLSGAGNCTNWTNNVNVVGQQGQASSKSINFVSNGNTGVSCANTASLICVEY